MCAKKSHDLYSDKGSTIFLNKYFKCIVYWTYNLLLFNYIIIYSIYLFQLLLFKYKVFMYENFIVHVKFHSY